MAGEQKKERSTMRFGHKPLLIAHLVIAALALAACGGTPTGQNWGGSSTGTGSTGTGSTKTYMIGGTVNGLSGAGLVLQDNGSDFLTITGTGTVTFTFATAVSGAYNVTVRTQPTNPVQSCTVTNGSGTATATVTNVQIDCTTSNTVGGTVTNLVGTGLVLLENGANNLKVTGSGTVTFTFLNSLANGATYTVTIGAQPTNPNQTCIVANGSGTITSGSVSNVQVSCTLPKYSVSGNVNGLVAKSGDPANCTNCIDTIELQDNAGDNLFVTGDVPFTFPTEFSYGTTYSANTFLSPSSQPQGCGIFNATAVVTANVTNVQVDCQHNDWAWMFPSGSPALNTYGTATLPTWSQGSTTPAPPYPTSNSNTPGGRELAMTWTDNLGNHWLFGGQGYEVTHSGSVAFPGYLNDMWVWQNWWTPGAWIPANIPIEENTAGLVPSYYANIQPLQSRDGSPVYSVMGTAPVSCSFPNQTCTIPGARWGGVTWTDAAGGAGSTGNLWLFGGQGYGIDPSDPTGTTVTFGLLSDVWEFNLVNGGTAGAPCAYDLYNSTTQTGTGTGTYTNCEWIFEGGSQKVNQPTTSTAPGGRWGASFYTDANHNLWMFGGQGYDSASNVGLLNDLWECAATSTPCTWTLVSSGSSSTTTVAANQEGVYGTQNTAAGNNVPGGRQNGVLWVDSSGNVWLFGGWGLDSVGTTATGLGPGNAQIGAILNDLWEYNPTTKEWTWISGSNKADQNGVYGTQGISNIVLNASTTNMPGSRWGAVGWVDPDSSAGTNLFLFGGFGFGSNSTEPTGFLNDVWEFQSSTGQWIWWKGSADVDQTGQYVINPVSFFQLPNTTVAVGARRGAAMWTPDSLGYVFMFGGQGYAAAGGSYGELNDLWIYLPFCAHDAPCPY
jgi:hypothetical protein